MRRIIEILEPRTLLSTYVINGGAGADVWQLEARPGQVIVNGQTINNPAITDVQVNAFDGTDLLVINAASIPVVYNSGPGGTNEARDRLRVGNGLLSTLVTAPITFNGSFGSSVELRDDSWSGYGNYDFSGGAAVTRRIRWGSGAGSLALDTSYVDVNTSAGGSSINFDPDDWGDVRTTFYGGNGADSLYVNFAELGVETATIAVVGFYGGGGNDTFQVDDSTSTGDAQSYNIMRNRIFQGAAAQVYFDAAVEIVGFVGSQSSPREFTLYDDNGSTHLYITGGNANDTFASLDSSWPMVVVSGGGGVDSLYVDDDYTENAVPFRASLEPTLLTRDRGTIFDYYRMNIQFFGIEAATYEAAPNTNRIDVYGTSSEIAPGLQWTIFCGAGNDNVTVHPHDEAGNLTINGNLGISGGGGTDTVTIDDRGSTTPIAYRFHNPFGPGTTNIGGLGTAGFGAAADFENVVVRAGDADDTVRIDTFTSGSSLTVNAGGGDDVLEFVPVSKRLDVNVTNMAAFNFDGGGGADEMSVYNDNSPNSWTYWRTNQYLRAQQFAYIITLPNSSVERIVATGGTQNDTFYVESTPPLATTQFDGGAGDDRYNVQRSDLRAAGVLGPVLVSGAGGGIESVAVYDTGETAATTVHIGDGTVGAVLGDNLFGAGGSLQYTSIRGSVAVYLGSGADTAYAVPDAQTRVHVDLGSQPAGSSDMLGLALAEAAGTVFTPGAPGAGTYTFANRAPLTFAGAESVVEDAVAPTVDASAFEVDLPAQAIVMQFNEDVSNTLSGGSVALTNTTTNETIDAALAYDPATNTATFTFAGFEHGILPDGDYQLTLPAGAVTDLFGNALVDEHALDLFFLQGDANHDRRVNLQDFNRLAANFGRTGGATFSQADFNYDGNVNLQDFNILAGRFGGALGPDGTLSVGRDQSALRPREMLDDLIA
jgi:hypothetical protein